MSAVETLREYQELGPSHEAFGGARASTVIQDFEGARPFVDEVVDSRAGWGLRWASLFLARSSRPAEAAEAVDRLRQDLPGEIRSHGAAGVVALFAGDHQGATRHLERAIELAGQPVGALVPLAYSRLYSDNATLLGYAHLKMGHEDRALGLFAETERYYTDRMARGDTSFQARMGLAAVNALRGDKEAAYDWLQRAIDAGFYAYAELEGFFLFDSLHGEERFQQMMDGLRATVEEARRQVHPIEPAGVRRPSLP